MKPGNPLERAASRSRHRDVALLGGAAVMSLLALSACSSGSTSSASVAHRHVGGGAHSSSGTTARSLPKAKPLHLGSSIKPGSQVPVDSRLTLSAHHGTIQSVTVRASGKAADVHGSSNAGHTTWTASDLLDPATTYQVVTHAKTTAGKSVMRHEHFSTADLRLDQQTYPTLLPAAGSTVGVGMPIVLRFDEPVTDKAAVQRTLSVSSKPRVKGSWHWYSDTEVHFRPVHYWRPGTKVTVKGALNGVKAGDDLYGENNVSSSFTIGRSLVDRVNLATDELKVFIDHKLARTIPVTGGKPGFTTRSGTKVIMEKDPSIDMDSTTVDIGGADAYNLEVYDAMRVTNSGEFLHSAPWSVYAQGSYNVSHGCVGMSPENAEWLFAQSNVGDVVHVTGTDRGIEPGNGWTDWDTSFKVYKQGSAL